MLVLHVKQAGVQADITCTAGCQELDFLPLPQLRPWGGPQEGAPRAGLDASGPP